jgi:AP2-associated kinase
MNTRLQHRLTEPEILKIFGDVAEGVACMHYLKPPLLHRDLKVENVLISKTSSGTPIYKLCDFGSAAVPRPAAKTTEEGRLIEEDVQKHTTMQYRSPEMIDVWRKQPIDEKADIWALGVLLYKLCYYTTPFEDVGQMAILNASYKYPAYPTFSDRLKKLIAWMLKEDPRNRPNIYEVLKEVCSMRGTEVPIEDIYANRTQSEARRNESLPSPEPPMSSIGLQKSTPQVQVQAIPDIAPMRRGRPTAPAQDAPVAAKPSPSPARGDPFAALDSKNYDVRAGAVDELSKRFPSLDEFSIAHEKGNPFTFSQGTPKPASDKASTSLDERVTHALADEAFGSISAKADTPKSQSTTQLQQHNKETPSEPTPMPRRQEAPPQPVVGQPTPVRPGVVYTSTGTNPSPPPSKPKPQQKLPEVSSRPIWRVPDHIRASSQPRASEAAQAAASSLQPSLPPTQRPALLEIHRSKSQTATLTAAAQLATSSRPSLEGHRRPSDFDLNSETTLSRTKSAQTRQRPSSVYLSSNLDFLRDQESTRKRTSLESKRHSRQASQDRDNIEDAPIGSDMDYLRNSEDNEGVGRKVSRKEWGHKKRSSLGGSISGAKNMFAGKFSDAFKRFEKDSGDERPVSKHEEAPTTPQNEEPRMLSPITGSETTPSRHSEIESALDETEDLQLPPDVRREIERRRLSQEEKRVAEAAAEYRARVAAQGTGCAPPPSRASTIQKRVQSLLDEGRQSPVARKTAEGYGRYTDSAQDAPPSPVKAQPPPLAKKPIAVPDASTFQYQKTRPQTANPSGPTPPALTASAPPGPRVVSRPSVPPKSQALRTGQRTAQWPPPQSTGNGDTEKPLPPKPSGGLAALLAKDLEGVPDYPPRGSSAAAAQAANQVRGNDSNAVASVPTNAFDAFDADMEEDFSKRYPSLSGIEMVETEIVGSNAGGGGERLMRVKDV